MTKTANTHHIFRQNASPLTEETERNEGEGDLKQTHSKNTSPLAGEVERSEGEGDPKQNHPKNTSPLAGEVERSEGEGDLKLAISIGEPAGIGPDIMLRAAQNPTARYLAFADPTALAERNQQLNLNIRLIETSEWPTTPTPSTLHVHPIYCQDKVIPGKLNPANSTMVLSAIDQACDACLTQHADAMVTGPVHKGVINEAGIPFTGHTDWIAKRCGTQDVIMLLASEQLRVALFTTHIPLNQVPAALKPQELTFFLRHLSQCLQQQLLIQHPRIGVCGLNPHAGEQGHLGQEDQTIIAPVIKQLHKEGLSIEGPWPADSIFNPLNRSQYDCIVGIYHDQALTPLKALSFGNIVNISLGLPIVRTSVDHGTALNLAGTGQAKLDSLQTAIKVACQMTPIHVSQPKTQILSFPRRRESRPKTQHY